MTQRQVVVHTCDRCGKEITALESASYDDPPMIHISLKVGRENDAAGGTEDVYAFRDICFQCAGTRLRYLERAVFATKTQHADALIPHIDNQDAWYLIDPDGADVIHKVLPKKPEPYYGGPLTGEEREGRAR